MHTDTDILIVGAGPVGLTLALLLAARGRSVAVYERWDAAFSLPRAVGLSHDTARAYQAAGVLADLLKHMDLNYEPLVGEYFTSDGEVLMTQIFPGTGASGFPPMTPFNQPDLEATLNAACAASPLISVHRGWNARDVVQTGDHAAITFDPVQGLSARDGDPIQARGRFVVGCDGANSAVRKLMDTTVTDTGFASSWLVVDLTLSDDLARTLKLGQSLDPTRPTTLAPSGRGRRRFEFMLMPDDEPETVASEQSVWALLEPWGLTPQNTGLVRRAVYTFRGCWADRWRDGRLLLAGDAAHQMPPFMAQGFNSGVRDAVALAWRLDLVLKGQAATDLLDTYTSERLAHVRQIIEQCVGFGQMICITDAEAAAGRDQFLRMMREQPEMAPPPPPEWRLGPGVLMPDHEKAGYLGLQARAEMDGRQGLMDDLIGPGRFLLLALDADPALKLSPEARAIWTSLSGACVGVGAGQAVKDLDDDYRAWFTSLGARVVLMRPDFHIFGAAADLAAADAMVKTLGASLKTKVAA